MTIRGLRIAAVMLAAGIIGVMTGCDRRVDYDDGYRVQRRSSHRRVYTTYPHRYRVAYPRKRVHVHTPHVTRSNRYSPPVVIRRPVVVQQGRRPVVIPQDRRPRVHGHPRRTEVRPPRRNRR